MTRLFPPAILAFAAVSAPAGASVTVGSSFATACFEAAESMHSTYDSIKSCDRALTEEKLDPQDRAATHVNRGILRLMRGSFAAAEADFNAALAIDPHEPEAWLNKAVAHARFGNSVDALAHIAKALEHGTRRPAIAYFVRAMEYEESGNIRAAYHDLQRAHQLDPEWDEPVIELKRFKVSQR